MSFLHLKELMNGSQYQIVELQEGNLGIPLTTEHELFTRLRTGLLGSILFPDRNYIFKYHKKGSKTIGNICVRVLTWMFLITRCIFVLQQ